MNKVNTLTLIDENFPEPLAQISGVPKELFWSGQPIRTWIDRPKVAVVGSRLATPYGKVVTTKLTDELARAGVVIISGLAYGIDITAHRAALNANGITVAILGAGLDQIYPAAHLQVAEDITRKGTLITEYPAGSPGFRSNFIARNRLVSGLADVLLITEAALKSGSLHTARFALEQGKTVMAVPGNITSPSSEGCNNLIKSGAVPVTSVDDVFFALGISPASQRAKQDFQGSETEQTVYQLIRQGIGDQDDLAAASRLSGSQLASALTMLEISGYIRPAGGGNWLAA